MHIQAELVPIEFPDGLTVEVGGKRFGVDLGSLTEEQAGELWDDMRGAWLAHYIERRRAFEVEQNPCSLDGLDLQRTGT